MTKRQRVRLFRMVGSWTCFCALLALGGCANRPQPIRVGEVSPLYQPFISQVGQILTGPNRQPIKDRYYLIRDLGMTREPAAFRVLRSILKDPDYNAYEKSIAAKAIAQTGEPGALDAIQEARDNGTIDAVTAVIAFGVLAWTGNNAQALDKVFSALDPERNEMVRLYAVSALGSLNPKHQGVSAALERVCHSDPSAIVRARAAKILVDNGQDPYQVIVEEASRHPDPQVRLEVMDEDE